MYHRYYNGARRGAGDAIHVQAISSGAGTLIDLQSTLLWPAIDRGESIFISSTSSLTYSFTGDPSYVLASGTATVLPAGTVTRVFVPKGTRYISASGFGGVIRMWASTVKLAPALDPYATLYGLMGGTPELVLHADDLSPGTLTTWTGRTTYSALWGGFSGAVVAGNWSGGAQCVTLNGTNQSIVADGLSAAISQTNSPYTIITACRNASGGNCGLWSFGANAATPYNYCYTNSTRVLSSFDGGSGATNETGLMTSALVGYSIVGFVFTGTTIRKVVLNSSGETVVSNNLPYVGIASTAFDRFTMGAFRRNTDALFGGIDFRFMAARAGTMSDANLTSALVHVRDNLACPLT